MRPLDQRIRPIFLPDEEPVLDADWNPKPRRKWWAVLFVSWVLLVVGLAALSLMLTGCEDAEASASRFAVGALALAAILFVAVTLRPGP